MTARFGRGDLRLLLLAALEDGPAHGYELMRAIEDKYAGLYRPSAGSIYPRLSALADAGLVVQQGRDYKLTAAGRRELDGRRDELRELATGAPRPPRRGGAALRAEIRAAAAEVRAQERRVARKGATSSRRGEGVPLRSLHVELRVFAADVLAAARRADFDVAAMERVVAALNRARAEVLAALAR